MTVFVKCAEKHFRYNLSPCFCCSGFLSLVFGGFGVTVALCEKLPKGEAEFGGMCYCGSQSLLCQKFLLAAQSRWASRTSTAQTRAQGQSLTATSALHLPFPWKYVESRREKIFLKHGAWNQGVDISSFH